MPARGEVMAERLDFLSNSLIVAAHPDDELLWFASILKDVDRVLLVYEDYWPDPNMGPARDRAIRNFPRANVSSLKLPEAATYGLANWRAPKLSPQGIEFSASANLRDIKQMVKRMTGCRLAPKVGVQKRYDENAAALYRELKPQLHADMNVFTHNPWGEYGHEDHVQVFRVLDKLRREIGFKLWMSNYCTERALPLAMTYFDTSPHTFIELRVDKDFAEQVADVYRHAGCWTWAESWNWFDTERFIEAPYEQAFSSQQGNLVPLNMFNIEPVAA